MEFLWCEEMSGGSYPASTKGQHSLISLSKSHPLFNPQGVLVRKKSWAEQPPLYFHSDSELSGPSLLLIGISQYHPDQTHLEASRKLPSKVYLREWEIWPILWKLTLLCVMIIFEINDTKSIHRNICRYSQSTISHFYYKWVNEWECYSQVQNHKDIHWVLALDHSKSFTYVEQKVFWKIYFLGLITHVYLSILELLWTMSSNSLV